MFGEKFVIMCFIIASVNADTKGEIKSTTQQSPELKNRFFGLENIFNQIFGPHNHGIGGHFQHSPEYHNQQNPQASFINWQNMQTPNQAQLNLDQYPQGSFNSQNSIPNQNNQSPQQFPNQFNQQPIMKPSQSIPQGNLNPGNNFGQNFNTGTLDDVPSQSGINQGAGNWNQPGSQSQNQMGQNSGNLFGFQNQNGNQGFQNQNGNQGFQNQGFQNQNGNQGFQSQSPRDEDYNPVAILGKPVPITTPVPDAIVFKDGCDTPTQRQCVQDCQSSTEYSPICGSNNVTYFNPGRFICARNCGINVFIQRPGRCYK